MILKMVVATFVSAGLTALILSVAQPTDDVAVIIGAGVGVSVGTLVVAFGRDW